MTTLASTMLVTSALVSSARRLLLDPENRDNGLQMAATVVLAYAVSLAAGLPEPFWAVMGALIVVRPNLASTFDAGFPPMYRTLVGAAWGTERSGAAGGPAGAGARRGLDGLGGLAGSAAGVSRLFRRPAATPDDRYHRRIAGLTNRVFQDVAVLNRVLRVASRQEDDWLWREAAPAPGAAVAQTADMVEGVAPSELDRLHRLADTPLLTAAAGQA